MIDPHSKVSLSILYGRPSNALSLGLIGCNRRLAKDFENLGLTLAAFVTLACIQIAVRQLAR